MMIVEMTSLRRSKRVRETAQRLSIAGLRLSLLTDKRRMSPATKSKGSVHDVAELKSSRSRRVGESTSSSDTKLRAGTASRMRGIEPRSEKLDVLGNAWYQSAFGGGSQRRTQ